MSKTTITVSLDKRCKKRKNLIFPVVLVLRIKGNPFRYPTIYSLSESDYQKLSSPRLTDEFQKIKENLKDIKLLADVYLRNHKSLDLFDFETNFVNKNQFLKRKKIKQVRSQKLPSEFDFTPYYSRFKILAETHNDPSMISFMYCEYIKKLLQEERIGTALNIKESYLSLIKFGGNVTYEDISPSYLTRYELWMRKKGCASATIGIKLRPLRTIFNEAIEAKIISRENCYPFGKRRYIIPSGKKSKRHLQAEALATLLSCKPTDPEKYRALQYWLFCYYGNGMNPHDLANLRYKNLLDNEFLSFIRRKTERTSKEDPQPIIVYLNEEMWRIIKEIGLPRQNENDFIFSIMDDTLNPLKQYALVTNFTKWLNDNMKIIGQELNMPIPPTSMVARHSLANRLKQVGASTEYIQETLGHSSKQTTEIYLGSFTSDIKKEFSKKIAFK